MESTVRDLQVVVVVFTIVLGLTSVTGQQLSEKHLTRSAQERPNDLKCYVCRTLDHGDNCVDLPPNNTNADFVHQCKEDRRICMVKRYSYTTSTENTTSVPKLWALERNCSSKCEPGCIIIGERTKLYACTACCENSLCNMGTGDADWLEPSVLLLAAILFLVARFSCRNAGCFVPMWECCQTLSYMYR